MALYLHPEGNRQRTTSGDLPPASGRPPAEMPAQGSDAALSEKIRSHEESVRQSRARAPPPGKEKPVSHAKEHLQRNGEHREGKLAHPGLVEKLENHWFELFMLCLLMLDILMVIAELFGEAVILNLEVRSQRTPPPHAALP